LVAVGLTLLVLGCVNLFGTSTPGVSTVGKQSTTSIAAPAKDQAGTTTTTVSSTDTTTPGKASVRSASTAAALLGLGAIVFLVGIFFGRIQEVTLPGGAGLKLSPQAQKAVKEKVAEKLKQDPQLKEDPTTGITLYDAALRELEARTLGTLGLSAAPAGATLETSPGDDVVEQAVDQAAKSLR
jgi:hypothetical protein